MITVEINSVDVTSQIEQRSLEITQRITYQVDTASFRVFKAGSKTLAPEYGDTVAIYDGAEKIFGGIVLSVQTSAISAVDGVYYQVRCVDHGYEMDKVLASRTYENQTIADIIADLVSSYTTGFTTTNVVSTFTIAKIVFNQIPLSVCIKRLADVVNSDWYVDKDKDVHFFSKYINTAPFGLTDTNGNLINKSLRRLSDGAQVANRVKVRGGEYNGSVFSDSITVKGNDSKSFSLPYRFANLVVTLDTGAGPVSQTVGIDFSDDDFTTSDVLYDFQQKTIRFENNLTDGDVIAFSGNRKTGTFGVAEDPVSIAQYGVVEKFIRDDSIESLEVARKRANAELYIYSEPIIDARFTTYTSGLHAGMVINVQSDTFGVDDELIIKNLTFKMRDHDNFFYEAELVSTRRYDFITLLQKMLEPDPRPGDEQETSEEIFTDTQVVTVQEEYEVVTPVEDDQTITVTENYELDPLGADTDAIYVLSPYTPNGQDDPRRPGRLDISLVVYDLAVTFTDTFETGLGNWINVAGDDWDWTRDSGGTPSVATGPSTGQGGSTWYVYTETSGFVIAGDEFILEGPALSAVGGRINFYFHMYGGTSMGTLYLEEYDGTTWSEIWSQVGAVQTANADPYQEVTQEFSFGTEKLRFRYVHGSGTPLWEGDCAIDTITISEYQV